MAALAACARNLADYEIRGQGTVGGNLCVGANYDAPRGDLQGCLLALDAKVRSAGAEEAVRALTGLGYGPGAADDAGRLRHSLISVRGKSANRVRGTLRSNGPPTVPGSRRSASRPRPRR